MLQVKNIYESKCKNAEYKKDIIRSVSFVISPRCEQFGRAAVRRFRGMERFWPSAIGEEVENGLSKFVLKLSYYTKILVEI